MTLPNRPHLNAGRGVALAVLAIPLGFLISALVSGFIGSFAAISAIVAPYLAGSLWQRGAGGPVSKGYRGSFLVVGIPAALAGLLGVILGTIYQAFKAVGGPGTPFGQQYWNQVGYVVRNGPTTEMLFWFGAAAVVSIFGVVGVLRTGAQAQRAADAVDITQHSATQHSAAHSAPPTSIPPVNSAIPSTTPAAPGQTTAVPPTPDPAASAQDAAAQARAAMLARAEAEAEAAKAAARAALPTTPTANAPSSGIILNGKPYNPTGKN